MKSALINGLLQALRNNPKFAKAMGMENLQPNEDLVRDGVRRIQLSSGGSTGVAKYLLLMRIPANSHDVLFYFKQQIPSAAQRADVGTETDSLPGRRVVNSTRELAQGQNAPLMSWCEIRGQSFTVQVREPWSEGIDPNRIFNPDLLLRASALLGNMAGASHRGSPSAEHMAAAMNPELYRQLQDLSFKYVKLMKMEYQALVSDPAARNDALAAQTARAAWGNTTGETR